MTDKKKGAPPFESAPTSDSTSANSTAPAPERGIYNPLTWRSEKSVKFRGKGKRKTRADAIRRKRGYGRIDPLLVAWLIVGSALLLVLIAEVAR